LTVLSIVCNHWDAGLVFVLSAPWFEVKAHKLWNFWRIKTLFKHDKRHENEIFLPNKASITTFISFSSQLYLNLFIELG